MLKILLAISFFAATAHAGNLSIAYPAEGTIISAQVGLIFEKTDILKKHGFTAKSRAMGTGRELKTALVSGKADVIMTSQTNFVVLLGSGFDGYAINTLGEAGRMALVVKPTSKIQSLTDLKGKRVATIFGTSIHQPLMEWLKENKLEKDVKVVDISSMAAMQAALKTGTIDAVMTWDPYLAQGLGNGTYRMLRDDTFGLITVSSAKFAQDKDAVARFNAATKEALVYLTTHKDEVNGWFSKMAKLDLRTIDEASHFNKNYGREKIEEVSLALTPEYRARLASEAKFLYDTKTVAKLADVGPHIVDVK